MQEDLPWSSCTSIATKIGADPEYRSVPELYDKAFRLAANMQIPALEWVTGSRKRNLEQHCSKDSEQIEVKICTFNMLAPGLLQKGCTAKGQDVPADMVWEARRERVLHVMRRSPVANIEPDIFAMQEVESNSFSSLCAGLDYDGVFLSKYPPERKREGAAVFVKKNKWRIIAEKSKGVCFQRPDFSEVLSKSPRDGAWPQKGLVVALQHSDVNQVKIVVAVGHLGKDPIGDVAGDLIRTMALEDLHRHAKEVAAEMGGVPYFLCLDQNADRSEMPFHYALHSGLLSVKGPSPTHNLAWEGSSHSVEHDFIYYARDLCPGCSADDENITSDVGDIGMTYPSRADGASDHAPVFGSFKLPYTLWK